MIVFDSATSTPPFEQIRSQLRAQILGGEILAGTRLPTVRRLAADLGVATNTVARAYKELEAMGLVETRGRAGTTVCAGDDFARTQAHAAAMAFAARMKELGLEWDDAADLARAAFAQT